MTGYYLRPGYQSNGSREEAWAVIRAIVADLRLDPNAIMAEVVRVDPKILLDEDYDECAMLYADDRDLTLRIFDAGREADQQDGPVIVQLASGGGKFREIKEQLRRAYCRLVIERCHAKGIEVNLEVA